MGHDAPRRRLRQVIDGRGRGLVVVGPAGVGKTELVRSVVAPLPPGICRWIVASPAARRIPFGAVTGLFAGGDVDAGDHTARMVAARAALVAGPQRPVVVVDDAPHLDPATVVVVSHLLRQDEATVVLTVREGQPLADELGRFLDDRVIDEQVVAPFRRGEVAELVGAVLGGPVDAGLIDAVMERSQGNALFVRELLTAALDGGAVQLRRGRWCLDGELAVPRRLVEVVARRITGASGEAVAGLQYVAVGQPLPLDAAIGLCGADALAALERDRLVVTAADEGRPVVRVAHPLVAEAVLDALERSRLAQCVQAVAQALDADHTRDGDRVLRWAVERLDAGVDVPAASLAAAARHAFSLLDHPLAVRLADAGVAAGDVFESRLVLGAARSAQLDLAGGELGLRDALAAARDDDERARAAGRLGLHLAIRAGRIDEAMALMREQLTGLTDPTWQAFLTADLRKVEALGGMAPSAAPVDAHDVVAQANTCIAGALLGALSGDVDGALVHVERGLELAPSVRSSLPNIADLLLLARYLSWSFAGAGDRAEALALGQMAEARLHRTEPLGMWCAVLASTALLTGSPRAALDRAAEARPLLAARDFLGGMLPQTTAVEAAARAQLGQAGAARGLLAEIPSEWLADAKTALSVATAEAWIAAGTGAHREAATAVVAAAQVAVTAGLVPLAALAAHDAVRLGHADLAVAVLADASGRAPATVAAVLHRSAVAHAADDPVAMEEACGELVAAGMQPLAAEGLQRAARRFRRRGRRADADRVERMASTLLRATQPSAAPHEVPNLSARELEIAALAAARWRTKEIAAHLGVSPRTVDNTLARLYRKVGVAGREDLARRLAAVGVLPPAPAPPGQR